jgi:predicted nucleic acid-binding protein
MSGDDAVTFVDTNVLVYAYDADAGRRHDIARAELARLWDTRTGAVSTQVLQEFYVTVTRKLPKSLPSSTAREVVGSYGAWPVHRPKAEDLVAASELEERHSLSFWDALVVVAAQRSGARWLLSEDLQAGRRFGDTRVANPFAER